MTLKAIAARIYASSAAKKVKCWSENALAIQAKQLQSLVQQAKNTVFGRLYHFNQIKHYQDFKAQVPIADYEKLKPYIEQIRQGEPDVLWPGLPIYFAKTSGTTSGEKYIPISKQSMPAHITAAKNALLLYIHATGKTDFVNGKMIFLQGSPILSKQHGIFSGRLSGIVAHHVPKYLQSNRLPSYQTNCIPDWEAKVNAIVDETLPKNMTLISGIPPWIQMYFDKLQEKTGKTIKDIFPNFNLLVHGGVNIAPYQAKLYQSIGKVIDTIETYPASEGFIAFADQSPQSGLLLNVNAGIFYEFVVATEFYNPNPTRINLAQVELNVNYVLILNTNAGLWGYNLGDTIAFTCLNPYKIVVTGRIKHFISAFGEHVIAEEVEDALMQALESAKLTMNAFTVAPQVNPPEKGLPYHQWLIEFSGKQPTNLEALALTLDALMQQKNSYYADLIQGKVLRPLRIVPLKTGAFTDYMRSKGKLGGQNKIPHLSNNREMADALMPFILR